MSSHVPGLIPQRKIQKYWEDRKGKLEKNIKTALKLLPKSLSPTFWKH